MAAPSEHWCALALWCVHSSHVPCFSAVTRAFLRGLCEPQTAFAIGALAALGFALAPIYPLTMHDTPRRFPGPAGARLVGLQVAATALGMASMPWLIGVIATRTSLVYLPAQLTLLAIAVVVLEQIRRR